jgi:heme exporter protein D
LNWNSWNEFVAMGGYGFYVWGSYFVTAALMVIELLVVAQRKRRAAAQLSAQDERAGRSQ